MRTKVAATAWLTLLLMTAPGARADLLFDNGGPDKANSHHSDLDNSSPSDTGVIGDDFSLLGDATLTGLTWFGNYAFDDSPTIDDFSIRIYDFSGAAPASNPLASISVGAATRTATGDFQEPMQGLLYEIYRYDAAFSGLDLAAGRYFLSVVNDTTGADVDWYWSDSGVGDAFARDSDSDPWGPYFGNVGLAFSVSGTGGAPVVPELASVLLLALASPLALIKSVRRRQLSGSVAEQGDSR